jgi:mRNA-degrading endonuclease RelE of RelBE toxin-antitoxin system
MILPQNAPYILRLEKPAAKAFAKLDRKDYSRTWDALLTLCATGQGDVTPLTGYAKGTLRLRVGDNRVLLFVESFVIEVIGIEPRGQVYKTKTRTRLKKRS